MAESDDDSAPVRIDKTIAELGDWRAETLSRMRMLIREADPAVIGHNAEVHRHRGRQTNAGWRVQLSDCRIFSCPAQPFEPRGS